MKRYFVVHAPRQTGKTTTIAALMASLKISTQPVEIAPGLPGKYGILPISWFTEHATASPSA